MKISAEQAALALTQTSPASASQKRREAADLEALKAKPSDARTIVDTVELSEAKPAPQNSRSEAQKLRLAAELPDAPPAEAAETAAGDPLAELLKSFGQRSTDEGFNSALDANGDGIINFADLNAAASKPAPAPPPTGGPLPVEPNPALANPASFASDSADTIEPSSDVEQPVAPAVTQTPDEQPATPSVFTFEDVDRALSAFGATAGDDAFNSAYDFDNDGAINFNDLNELLSRVGDQTSSQQTLLDQLTERFGASTGNERFNPNLDFDSDGVISFGDLNTLLANLAKSANPGE